VFCPSAACSNRSSPSDYLELFEDVSPDAVEDSDAVNWAMLTQTMVCPADRVELVSKLSFESLLEFSFESLLEFSFESLLEFSFESLLEFSFESLLEFSFESLLEFSFEL